MAEQIISYHLLEGTDILSIELDRLLEGEREIFLLTDSNVASTCLIDLLHSSEELKRADIIELEPGEENKSLEVCNHLWTHLLENAASRNAILICLGGGVITDLGGFVACSYKRGIRFIHIPTSLMAMNDAAIGGKNGIDHQGTKNVIGSFALPEALLICPDFLYTLHETELKSGFAEMLKHALIADAELWKKLTKKNVILEDIAIRHLRQSMDIKISICRKDLNEQNARKLLNFGHSYGHALESWMLKNGELVTHGQAVAWGMIAESFLSVKYAGLPVEEALAIRDHLFRIFPLSGRPIPRYTDLITYLRNDKKNTQIDSFNFTLLNQIGSGSINHEVRFEDAEEIWNRAFTL